MDVKAKLDEMQAQYNLLCAEYGHASILAAEAQARADGLRSQVNAFRVEHAKLASLMSGPKKAPSASAVASEPSPDTAGA